MGARVGFGEPLAGEGLGFREIVGQSPNLGMGDKKGFGTTEVALQR